jgi:glycosyltransferase involved in cell wall biosynthesis
MNLMITCEFRFFQTPDGQVWTPSSFQHSFWLRYLNVFEKVIVIARVQKVDHAEQDWRLSSGDNVSFFPLPYYVGILGLLTKLPLTLYKLLRASRLKGLFLCRVPSQTANLLTMILRKKRHFALEVVGDPYDVFSSGVGGRIATLLRNSSTKSLQKQCQRALGASYVTEQYLQKRYPVGKQTYPSFYSSIMLDDSQIVEQSKAYLMPARKLLFVGSLNQLYKAPDILLSAFAKLVQEDKNYQLTLLGAGKYLPQLQQQANDLGINDNVYFKGEVNSEEVLTYLQETELFVLPSRTEGLPRAMIEAMAQALPCVGSNAGGIPELLSPDYCVPTDEVNTLYATLNDLCNNIEKLTHQSAINLAKSHNYRCEFLTEKRTKFYQKLRELNQ